MSKTFEIANASVAAQVSEKLTRSFNLLGDTILLVNSSCSEDDAKEYREYVGDAFYAIVFKLLEPIYEQHPQLKPPEWDQREGAK